MEKSYLNATVYGVGQLITQRKMLKVPEHQRDFAWYEDEVSQFFNDITDALGRGDPDYFIGLIVLLGPLEKTWLILDGQQRLATTIMIYSAIRFWLSIRNYDDDAKQIESEFIGVREYGGDVNSRLTMNVGNRDFFEKFVVRKAPSEEINQKLNTVPRLSSNSILIKSALVCRELVENFTQEAGDNQGEQVALLFNLASYLESKVKAVVMDLPSEKNAYVIFESLNARGNELTVLDLVKNYVFGNANEEVIADVRENWMKMAQKIEDKNADDFLKVFWTSRFGRVQMPQLYGRIRDGFEGADGAKSLATSLATSSDYYAALEDPKHEIWSEYGLVSQGHIETLILLGNRQVRAPIVSAIEKFEREEMQSLLWALIVLTIRYQVVGKRRTGALEIACARLAESIYIQEISTTEALFEFLRHIIPKDEEFQVDFLAFSERKPSRATYLLIQLEKTYRSLKSLEISDIETIIHDPSGMKTEFILPKTPGEAWKKIIDADPDLLDDCLYLLGNRILLERELVNLEHSNRSFGESLRDYYCKSKFLLTSELGVNNNSWVRHTIMSRQKLLAELALQTWHL